MRMKTLLCSVMGSLRLKKMFEVHLAISTTMYFGVY